MGLSSPHLDLLVDAARAGSPDAFGELWRRLSPKVTGYARGRGVADPADFTSEVFLAAFQRIDAFVGDGAAFQRWLFTIAHHRAVDDLRRRSRRGVDVVYEPDADPRRSPSAEAGALARLGDAAALELLSDMPDDQRNVILLRVVADLSVAEVAEMLDRSPDAVRQLQRRALARLKRRVGAATPPVVAVGDGRPDSIGHP